MPPYDWMHLENTWWMLGGGLLFSVAIILARGSRHFSFSGSKRSEAELEETHEFADGLKEQYRPVPLFIWLVAIGFFVWSIAYAIFSGIRGLQ